MWNLENFKEQQLQEFIRQVDISKQININLAIAQCQLFLEQYSQPEVKDERVGNVLLVISAVAAQSLYSFLHSYLPKDFTESTSTELVTNVAVVGTTTSVMAEGLQRFYNYVANLNDFTRELNILLCYLYLERNRGNDIFSAEAIYKENLQALAGDIKDTDGSLLWLAAKFADWETVAKLLLLEGIDVNVSPQIGTDVGSTVLALAVKAQEWEIVSTLIRKGVKYSYELFQQAVASDAKSVVEQLLALDRDWLLRKDSATSILLTAAQSGNWELVKSLIEKGADINIRMPSGYTICEILLELAAESGIRDFVKELGLPIVEEYKYQFGYGRGNITYDGCLIACAAIADSKADPNEFNPVVLNDTPELQDFFSLIHAQQQLLDGRSFKFILAGYHWISGLIEVHADNIRILFVDPLGEKKFLEGDFFEIHPMQMVRETFQHEAEIIIAKEARQFTFKGCSIYAIDDARKLYKIKELSNNLNNSMLRSMESLTRLNKYIASAPANIEQAVNKKGETFAQSVQNYIKDKDGYDINARIDHKLEMLNKKVLAFLQKYSPQEAEQAKRKFTLQQLQAEFANQKRPTNKM